MGDQCGPLSAESDCPVHSLKMLLSKAASGDRFFEVTARSHRGSSWGLSIGFWPG